VADVTYVSRLTSIGAFAGPASTASTAGLEVFDRSVESSYSGPWSSSWVRTRQRSELLPRGVHLLATAEGYTQWNSRGSSSASYSNVLTVVFELSRPKAYRFTGAGGASLPPTPARVTVTGVSGPPIIVYGGYDEPADRRGVLPAGRYTLHSSWDSSASAGAPVGGPDLVVALDFECRADFNGDGFLDFFDYDEYVSCFETGVCPPGRTADFNGDGFADFFDYDAFVGAFEEGC
jgi:hypothetical protein